MSIFLLFQHNLCLIRYTFPNVSLTFLSRPESLSDDLVQLFFLFLCLWSVVVYPFCPQLCIDAEIRQDATKKRQSSLRVDHTVAFILLWEQTWHPSCQDFFHTQFYVGNWKHCTLRYACGLNYFAHFDSSITQNDNVDFVNLLWMYGHVQTHLPNCK